MRMLTEFLELLPWEVYIHYIHFLYPFPLSSSIIIKLFFRTSILSQVPVVRHNGTHKSCSEHLPPAYDGENRRTRDVLKSQDQIWVTSRLSRSTTDAGYEGVRHWPGGAIVCASWRRGPAEGQHWSQERVQTANEGDRVAWIRTVPVFNAVEAGDSGQLRPTADMEWAGSNL